MGPPRTPAVAAFARVIDDLGFYDIEPGDLQCVAELEAENGGYEPSLMS